MEELINHFKYFSEGIVVPKGHTYAQVESPKGEYGVTLISDGSNVPYKCKIRTPSYYHLQLMDTMIQGSFVSDLITIIGSQDLVMGEVDK
jgi:NADH-quinone oxidoreductase subunit D